MMSPFLAGVLAFFVAAVAPPGEAELDLPKPTVLAKGDGFIVHGLGARARFFTLMGHPASAATVLHTSRPSGELVLLAQSGTAVGIPVPMAIDRFPITQTRIAGVAADAERLYVLIWTARWTHEDIRGMGVQIHPPKSDLYKVNVFWLADGSAIGEFALTGEKRPKDMPPEKLDTGPMRVDDAGVTVHGDVFRFKGKERLR
jgi:hypothetical protein